MGLWRNLLSRKFLPVVIQKVVGRVLDRRHARQADRARAWCEERVEDFDAFARQIDAALWEETAAFSRTLEAHAREELARLSVNLGGGGHYGLLYFLTRLTKPSTVVETGVAAGFSSYAILQAMQENGTGTLHSSDFPYFRLDDPTAYVGILVPESLRGRWHLMTDGDRANLTMVTSKVQRVDLFHYDSDKSYRGRAFAMETMARILAPDAIVIMDDIQDNLFFRDHVTSRGLTFRVFGFGGKYLGLIGR